MLFFSIPLYLYDDYDFNDSPSSHHRHEHRWGSSSSSSHPRNGSGPLDREDVGSLGRILSALNPFAWMDDDEGGDAGDENRYEYYQLLAEKRTDQILQ